MSIRLVPFWRGHLATYQPEQIDIDAMGIQALHKTCVKWEGGGAVSAIDERNKCIGIGGITPTELGLEVWVLGSAEFRRRKFSMYRLVKFGLERARMDQNFTRVVARVRNMEPACRWAERFGFKKIDATDSWALYERAW